MAVTRFNETIRMTAAADTVAGPLRVCAMIFAVGDTAGEFMLKDSAGNEVCAVNCAINTPLSVSFPSPKLFANGIELDAVPANGELILFLA